MLSLTFKDCGIVIVLSPQPNPKIRRAKTFWIEMGQRTDTALPEAHTSSPIQKTNRRGGIGEWLTKYVGCSDLELRKLAGQIQKQIREKCTKTTGKVLGFPYSHLAFSLELDKLVGQIQRQIQIKMHKG